MNTADMVGDLIACMLGLILGITIGAWLFAPDKPKPTLVTMEVMRAAYTACKDQGDLKYIRVTPKGTELVCEGGVLLHLELTNEQ